MNPQDLLIRHVEKVVVALVLAICAWWIWDDLTSTAIRFEQKGPNGAIVDVQSIEQGIKHIEAIRPDLRPPQMRQPREYAQELEGAIARALPHKPFMGWQTAHPDRVKVIPDVGHYFYYYELLPPQVAVKDATGNLELTFSMPSEVRPKDARIADAAKVSWERKIGKDPLINTAERTGLMIEMKVGEKGPWQPVRAPGQIVAGVLPIEKAGEVVVVREVQASEQYAFRARLVAKATGYHFDPTSKVFTNVLVCPRRFAPEDQVPSHAELDGKHKPQVLGTPPDAARVAALGHQLGTVIAGTNPPERQYLSDWSEETGVRAKSTTRLAFDRILADPNNPEAPPGAVILLNRLLRNKAGDRQMWLDQPYSFKVQPGGAVGDVVPHADPFDPKNPLRIPLDLKTPWVLDRAEKGVERIVYYFIVEEPRPVQSRDKQLRLDARKIPSTDVAVLRNTKTNETLKLYRLVNIPRPRAGSPVYPDLRFGPAGFDEEAAFRKDPDGFDQWHFELPETPKPVVHKPNMGPLAELRRRGNTNAETDVDYIEFPDGRLFWWEHRNNHRRLDGFVPGKEPKGAVAPPPPVEDPAAPVVAPEAPAPAAAAPAGATAKPALAPTGR